MFGPFNKIKRILIVNRSEIAARIQATAHRFGIETVLVYTKEDANNPHLRYAHALYPLTQEGVAGYLADEELFVIARKARVDAIHPGYGFFSENATFAQRVIDAGFIWIGPDPETIEAMGDKSHARIAAHAAGIPIIPGASFQTHEQKQAYTFAQTIGFPILLKPALGGGGKGMHVIETYDDFYAAWNTLTQLNTRLYQNTKVLVEKYLPQPRHVEVQIAGDGTHALHFYERECSIQRNKQKIIEEAPCHFISHTLKKKLYAAALRLVRTTHYKNIGTVEFAITPEEDFYFLEVNTRLQVEHSVTEMITGVDLVALQFHIAEHGSLPLTQSMIMCQGHSIECRISTEDPNNNFHPATGTIHVFDFPPLPRIRYDLNLHPPTTITPFFDPMIGKITAVGSTREDACRTLIATLSGGTLHGVTTTIPFLISILKSSRFKKGHFHTQNITDFISAFSSTTTKPTVLTPSHSIAIATALVKILQTKPSHTKNKSSSFWKTRTWRQ